MPDPSLLTVIVNFRTPELTLKSIKAAAHETHQIPGDIVVVDNGSGDDSFDTIAAGIAAMGTRCAGRVRIVQTPLNDGQAAAINFGIRQGLADGSIPDFIYVLSSDAWPEPGAVRRLLDFLIATPGAGIVGSRVRSPDGDAQKTAFRFPSVAGEFEAAARTGMISRLLSDAAMAPEIPEVEARVDWVAGTSMMIRHRVLDEIGLFDESFYRYFEETDLCKRAADAGWRTHYLPTSVVVHMAAASTGVPSWRRTPQHWFESRMHYFIKTNGRAYTAAATAARINGSLIWRVHRLFPGKPQGDPDRFLRDLMVHSMRSMTRPQRARITPRLSAAPIKDAR